jgi:predicted enzyme related to lactoylglutathione lyase
MNRDASPSPSFDAALARAVANGGRIVEPKTALAAG